MKRSELRKLFTETKAAFDAEIDRLRENRMLKPKAAEDIKAGATDGMRNMWMALQRAGHLTIEEDVES